MHRSLELMYQLAESGQSEALFAHLAELAGQNPEDKDPPHLALIAAAESNQIETVLALIALGASVEGASNRQYIHPLWKAAKRGHLAMVKLLVESGASPFATDNDGLTALDYARRYSRDDVAAYLESVEARGSGNDA